jgi:hypothetical protein
MINLWLLMQNILLTFRAFACLFGFLIVSITYDVLNTQLGFAGTTYFSSLSSTLKIYELIMMIILVCGDLQDGWCVINKCFC